MSLSKHFKQLTGSDTTEDTTTSLEGLFSSKEYSDVVSNEERRQLADLGGAFRYLTGLSESMESFPSGVSLEGASPFTKMIEEQVDIVLSSTDCVSEEAASDIFQKVKQGAKNVWRKLMNLYNDLFGKLSAQIVAYISSRPAQLTKQIKAVSAAAKSWPDTISGQLTSPVPLPKIGFENVEGYSSYLPHITRQVKEVVVGQIKALTSPAAKAGVTELGSDMEKLYYSYIDLPPEKRKEFDATESVEKAVSDASKVFDAIVSGSDRMSIMYGNDGFDVATVDLEMYGKVKEYLVITHVRSDVVKRGMHRLVDIPNLYRQSKVDTLSSSSDNTTTEIPKKQDVLDFVEMVKDYPSELKRAADAYKPILNSVLKVHRFNMKVSKNKDISYPDDRELLLATEVKLAALFTICSVVESMFAGLSKVINELTRYVYQCHTNLPKA